MNSLIFLKNQTKSKDVNLQELFNEIKALNLSENFIYCIETNKDSFAVVFENNLNQASIDLVNGVVENHEGGEAVVPTKVELSNKDSLGEPVVTIKKPSGNSESYISHNFCDNTTWQATNDSKWGLTPPSGTKYKVLRAEVQFSHDIKLETLATPKKFYYKVYAGGAVVKEIVFNGVADLFDWANEHYTMNATVDGVAGMTTCVFDYADGIVLDPALGMKIELSIEDDTQLEGKKCTGTFVVEPITV